MSIIFRDKIPDDVPIFVSARGSQYILRNGHRVYVRDSEYKYAPKYKLKRGAFERYVNSQLIQIKNNK